MRTLPSQASSLWFCTLFFPMVQWFQEHWLGDQNFLMEILFFCVWMLLVEHLLFARDCMWTQLVIACGSVPASIMCTSVSLYHDCMTNHPWGLAALSLYCYFISLLLDVHFQGRVSDEGVMHLLWHAQSSSPFKVCNLLHSVLCSSQTRPDCLSEHITYNLHFKMYVEYLLS